VREGSEKQEGSPCKGETGGDDEWPQLQIAVGAGRGKLRKSSAKPSIDRKGGELFVGSGQRGGKTDDYLYEGDEPMEGDR